MQKRYREFVDLCDRRGIIIESIHREGRRNVIEFRAGAGPVQRTRRSISVGGDALHKDVAHIARLAFR